MATHYSTEHIEPAHRFAFWRDVICDAYLPIHCETPCQNSFTGAIALDRLSRLEISRVQGSPQRITRGKDHIGRNSDAFFMLSLQLSDVGHLSQAGRSTILQPGDFALYSTAEPYEIQCQSEVDQLIVQIPSEALLKRVPHAEMLTGLGVSARSSIGGLVSSQLQQCASNVAGQSEAVQQHLQEMILDLVAAGMASLSDQTITLSRPDQMVLARAKSVIRDNLHDEALNPAMVARDVGMSPRNLGRVFQRENISIAAFIRRSRLQAIAADLTDPRMAAVTISEIACKWGISNFQHFSKVFKDSYGMTPRDYRMSRRLMQ